jgi:hypothetical protein
MPLFRAHGLSLLLPCGERKIKTVREFLSLSQYVTRTMSGDAKARLHIGSKPKPPICFAMSIDL